MSKKKRNIPQISRIRGTYHLSQLGVETDEIRSLILRRRLQILVHSCIYYVYNDNIIPDDLWSKWAKELSQLQEQYPNIASRVDYANEFIGFDGSTGYHLPTRNPEIMSKAQYLLKLHKEDKYGYSGYKVDRAKPGGNVIRLKIP